MIDPLLKLILNFRQTLIRLGIADKDEDIFKKVVEFLKRHNEK